MDRWVKRWLPKKLMEPFLPKCSQQSKKLNMENDQQEIGGWFSSCLSESLVKKPKHTDIRPDWNRKNYFKGLGYLTVLSLIPKLDLMPDRMRFTIVYRVSLFGNWHQGVADLPNNLGDSLAQRWCGKWISLRFDTRLRYLTPFGVCRVHLDHRLVWICSVLGNS